MTHPQTEIKQNGRTPWRVPMALAAAGILGAGVLGTTIGGGVPITTAQAESAKTVMTPMGRAPLSFADLVKSVRPAVISINVQNGAKRSRGSFNDNQNRRSMPDIPKDHPLHDFFERFNKDFGGKKRSPRNRRSLAQGSGFIITADGFAVTNHHVVDDASKIMVTLDDGSKVDAELVGSDARTDLALIKIKSDKKFKFVEFAETQAEVGDWVLAVGNPFGLGGTVTAGIVSAHKRDIGSGPYDYLQIDAAVNRGNSGGPAFNLEGKVVGVNTAIFSPSGGNVGIAFAVPAALAKNVVGQLKEHKSVARGWLGVTIQNVTDDLADSVGLDKPRGAMVTNLSDGGPATRSEMEVGDVILKVDESPIADSRDLARKIAAYRPKTDVDVTVLRDGKERKVKVELGRFPGMKQLAALQRGEPTPEVKEMNDLGLALAPASELAGAGEDGVVITEVDPQSRAAEKGLKEGDVILEVAGKKVSSPKDVVNGVSKAKDRGRKAVLLRLKSGKQVRFVALPFKKS